MYFLPSPSKVTAAVALVYFVIIGAASFSLADERPSRIVSINLCADQLLMSLADADQIIGLSPWARDPRLSYSAARASTYPVLGATAEEILAAKPDLVIAGAFGRQATRQMLVRHGIRLIELEPVRSIEEARAQLRYVAELVGHPTRGGAIIASIDTALAELQASVRITSVSALYLQRRGYVAGTNSLITSLMSHAGLVNTAAKIGLAIGGQLRLEQIVAARPDILVLADTSQTAEDQGSALLAHPVLDRLFPPARRIHIPERTTICGGPGLVDAIQALATATRALQ
jgi:iron complex transport system substrate-binding protein